jgi:hypothetical protein
MQKDAIVHWPLSYGKKHVSGFPTYEIYVPQHPMKSLKAPRLSLNPIVLGFSIFLFFSLFSSSFYACAWVRLLVSCKKAI